MLDMKLNSGKLIIDDNNEVHVDKKMEKEILNGFSQLDENKDKKEPSLKIED